MISRTSGGGMNTVSHMLVILGGNMAHDVTHWVRNGQDVTLQKVHMWVQIKNMDQSWQIIQWTCYAEISLKVIPARMDWRMCLS